MSGPGRQWPIGGGDGMSQARRRAYWEGEHAERDYQGVLSISQDDVEEALTCSAWRWRSSTLLNWPGTPASTTPGAMTPT